MPTDPKARGSNPFGPPTIAVTALMSYGPIRKTAAGQPAAAAGIQAVDGSGHREPNRVIAGPLRPGVARVRTIRRGEPLVLATLMFGLVGCTESTAPPTTTMPAAAPATTVAATGPVAAAMMDDPTLASTATTPAGAQPRLASDPAQLADDLVADE